MKSSPFFSIVIPIYKVEKYLNKCVDSILTQDFTDFELILVDDGSPDECPEICDEYALKDFRVKVLHKTNGGLSSARNVGIRNARGNYIIFVDSDDYWNSKQALSIIFGKLSIVENVDVLVFNNIDHSCVTDEEVICERQYNIDFMEHSDKEAVLKYLFRNELFPGAAWLTVTRRAFLLKNNIKFIEGIKAEDIDWLLNVYLHAERFSALNQAFYVYLKYRNDSITGTADVKSIYDILDTLDIWTKRLKNNRYEEIRDAVYGYLSTHYICAILVYDKISPVDKDSCKNRLKSYKKICKYNNSSAIKLLRLFPISLLSKLLNVYREKRKF